VECGAAYESFSSLSDWAGQSVEAKITFVGSVKSGYRQSLLVGCGSDMSEASFHGCALEEEWYGQDYRVEPYPIQLSPKRMKLFVRSLGSVPDIEMARSDPDGLWSLSLRGDIGGRPRIFEVIASDTTFRRVMSRLDEAVRGEYRAWWQMNYWKNYFASDLGVDSTWSPTPPP